MGRVLEDCGKVERARLKNRGRGSGFSAPAPGKRREENKMLGCVKCKYWDRTFDEDGSFEDKHKCKNNKFHKYMRESYGEKSRKWLFSKQYCEFAKERKPEKKVAA